MGLACLIIAQIFVWAGFSELSVGQGGSSEEKPHNDCRSTVVKIFEPEYLPKMVSDNLPDQPLAPFRPGEMPKTLAVLNSGRHVIDFIKNSYRNGKPHIDFQGQKIAAPIGAKWDDDNIVFKLKKREIPDSSILTGSVAIQKFEDFPPDHVFEEFFNKARRQGYQPLDPKGYFSIIATGNQPHLTQELPDVIGYSVMSFSYPGMGEMFFVEGVIKAIFVTVSPSHGNTYKGAYLIVDTPAANDVTIPLSEEPAHNNTSNVWIKKMVSE
jgi:hypothetical protein